jgi:hypothetical protein
MATPPGVVPAEGPTVTPMKASSPIFNYHDDDFILFIGRISSKLLHPNYSSKLLLQTTTSNVILLLKYG